MKNSAALCQMFMAWILSLVCKNFPDATILHYMGDILICTETNTYLEAVLEKTITAIKDAGFEIARNKVQHSCPWTYLGLRIAERTIAPLCRGFPYRYP